MEKNRELNELLGLCWHSPATPAMSHVGGSVCKKCKQRFDENPNYAADAGKVQLLREMRKRADWWSFCMYLSSGIEPEQLLRFFVLGTDGEARAAAIKWLKKEAAEEREK